MKTYATPVAFRTAIEARLRQRTSGAGFLRRRLLFVFGRFLARLDAQLGSNYIVKGGLALELRFDNARTTKDIDLCVLGDGNELLDRLQAAGRRDLNDFMTFEVTPDGDITGDGVVYGGEHFKVHCRLGGKTYVHFPVDVVVGCIMLGDATRVTYRDDLSFVGIPPPTVMLIPILTHIAEKLHAYTLPRTTTNFRVRDLPDLALLATSEEPLRSGTLRSALVLTFDARKTHAVPARVPPPPDWERDYATLARDNELQWQTLAEVYAAVAAFLDPVLAGNDDLLWGRDAWRWSKP